MFNENNNSETLIFSKNIFLSLHFIKFNNILFVKIQLHSTTSNNPGVFTLRSHH